MRLIKEIGKKILGKGVILRIQSGPLQGLRYRLNRHSSLSPLWGKWEPDSQRIFSSLVQPGDCVYDLGANTGIHAMHFCLLTGKRGAVYAFEPMPFNIAELELIKSLNQLDNLEILSQAVSNAAGRAEFALGLHTKGGSLNPNHRATDVVSVEVVTLDALIADGRIRPPDFVKIDIEGAESMALSGMQRSLTEHQPTMYIELHSPSEDVNVGRILKAHGYSAYRVRSPLALELGGQRSFLTPIQDLEKGYPHPEGRPKVISCGTGWRRCPVRQGRVAAQRTLDEAPCQP